MSKDSFREYFANVKKFVIMKPFLEKAKITNYNFSYFMKGSEFNHLLSVEKLTKLQCVITETFNDIL